MEDDKLVGIPSEDLIAEQPSEDLNAEQPAKKSAKKPKKHIIAEQPAEDLVAEQPAEDLIAEQSAEDLIVAIPAKKSAKKPKKHIIAEKPAKDLIAEQPAEDLVAEQPAEDLIVAQPAKKTAKPRKKHIIAEKPAKDLITEQPAEDLVAEQPAEDLIAEQSVEDLIVAKPAKKSAKKPKKHIITEQPAEDLVAEQPAEDLVAEQPAEDLVAEQPAEDLIVAQPAKKTAKPRKKHTIADQPAEILNAEQPAEDMIVDQPAEDSVAEQAAEDMSEQPAENAFAEKSAQKEKTIQFKLGNKQIDLPVKSIIRLSIAAACFVLLCIGAVFSYKVFVNPQSAFKTVAMNPMVTPEIDDIEPEDPEEYLEEDDLAAITAAPTIDPLVKLNQAADKSMMNGIVNVVLIGVDHAAERDSWNKYFYSDVMLVLAIDFNNNRVNMISVPRDTYSPIYKTKGKYKLNSSFYWGGGKDKQGYEYVCRSIETVLGGIPVPYYIGVDMPAVKQLVDMVGGVDFNVDMAFTIQGRTLNTGMQHLNGQQVLDYFRARHKTSQRSDLQRVDREKALLFETFKQLKSSKKLMDVPQIFQMLSDQVKTNMTFEQLCALAYFGMHLDEKNIGMHTMPGKYAYMIYNWNYVILDQPKRVKLIEDIYGVKVPQMKKYAMAYCKREWANMQAKHYMGIVTKELEKETARPPQSKKFAEPVFILLNQRLIELQEARETNNYEKINLANEQLKTDAEAVFKAAGIKADWFVNENPGRPRLTG